MASKNFHIRPGFPDFLDLPWERPLKDWPGRCASLVELPRGPSRHEVLFVEQAGQVYAIKELPDERLAEREYENLRVLAEKNLPAVEPVGHTVLQRDDGEITSVLITVFLENSLPYRALFFQSGMSRYWDRLWDALASMMVRLHLAGFYWGDCSLSNILFKRRTEELGAYLVDAETSSAHEVLTAGQREQDLAIMEENICGSLLDVAAESGSVLAEPAEKIAASVKERYLRLWDEINRELIINPDERYKIRERIESLNKMGFSVAEVEFVEMGERGKLRMRTLVTDQSYHRHQLHSLTGIAAEDAEARQIFNEIQTLRAAMSRDQNRSISLSAAAFRWLNEVFYPTAAKLKTKDGPEMAARYCQVLEHKWYLSEKARKDVGLETALDDFLRRFGKTLSKDGEIDILAP